MDKLQRQKLRENAKDDQRMKDEIREKIETAEIDKEFVVKETRNTIVIDKGKLLEVLE